MAKFKCVHSGCVYEFTDEATVKTMRAHAEYTEVAEQTPVAIVAKEPKAVPPIKKEKL